MCKFQQTQTLRWLWPSCGLISISWMSTMSASRPSFNVPSWYPNSHPCTISSFNPSLKMRTWRNYRSRAWRGRYNWHRRPRGRRLPKRVMPINSRPLRRNKPIQTSPSSALPPSSSSKVRRKGRSAAGVAQARTRTKAVIIITRTGPIQYYISHITMERK